MPLSQIAALNNRIYPDLVTTAGSAVEKLVLTFMCEIANQMNQEYGINVDIGIVHLASERSRVLVQLALL